MRFIKNIIKYIVAGITATIILSVILSFYFCWSGHIANKLGNTDYVWPANSIWMKMNEGIAWGRFDANGFNNLEVIDNPDVIILGSSHMEAAFLMQDENVGYLLGEKLKDEYTVYNMGISGHNFFKISQYLPNNLTLYDNSPEFTIMETSTVDLTNESVDEVIQSSVEYTPSYTKGIMVEIQKSPFFRLLYRQIQEGLFDLFMPEKKAAEAKADSIQIKMEETIDDIDVNAYNRLFKYLSDLQKKYGTNIIIFYHPTEQLNPDGSIEFENDKSLEIFSQTAEEYGIKFINMADDFEKMYYEEHHVPHGFITGRLGAGHLNKYGHAAVADALYDAIKELEEDKSHADD